uniref:CortBP2 domain-containing protein n=1 Tax=Parastrongyloides trichosuri TaxID=131310 RepID=A0A0N4ZC76_PARTI
MDLKECFVAKHFSNEELLRMVTYLEAELQAKECYIAVMKNEKIKNILHNAKYGKLPKVDDPLEALKRDSKLVDTKFDEEQIRAFYEKQFQGIEDLVKSQQKYQSNCKTFLAAAESRSAQIIKDLEIQGKQKDDVIKHSEDINLKLEKEKAELKNSLLSMTSEINELKSKLERNDTSLKDEKRRTRTMILYLMEERKKIILSKYELELKCKSLEAKANASIPIDTTLVSELKREIKNLKDEKIKITGNLQELRERNTQLEMIVKNQREDLTLIRKNILAKTKHDNVIPQMGVMGCGVLNTVIKNNDYQEINRIPNSSTFPTTSKESSIPVFNSKTSNNHLPVSRLTFTSERRYPRTVPNLPSRPPVGGMNTLKKVPSPIKNVPSMTITNTGVDKLNINGHIDGTSPQMKVQSSQNRISRVPTMPSNQRSTSLPRTTLQIQNQSLKTLQLFPKIIKNEGTLSLSPKKCTLNNRMQNVSPCHNNNSPSKNGVFPQQML